MTSVGYSIEYYDARNNKYKIQRRALRFNWAHCNDVPEGKCTFGFWLSKPLGTSPSRKLADRWVQIIAGTSNCRGIEKWSQKACQCSVLSTTNPRLTIMWLNAVFWGENPQPCEIRHSFNTLKVLKKTSKWEQQTRCKCYINDLYIRNRNWVGGGH